MIREQLLTAEISLNNLEQGAHLGSEVLVLHIGKVHCVRDEPLLPPCLCHRVDKS